MKLVVGWRHVSVSAFQGWWTTKKKPKKCYFPRRRESDDKNAVAIVKSVSQLGVVYHKIQMHSFLKVESLGEARCRKSWNQLTQRVRFTKSTPRQASIRENKGLSLGKYKSKNPHQRSPYAMKIEGKSHAVTERQQWYARSKAWNLAKNNYKLKEKDKAVFHSPAEEWILPAASTKEPEER